MFDARQPTHTRKGKTIKGPGQPEQFNSINAAKRASRAIQMKADGALGRGTLRLVNQRKKNESLSVN